MPFPGGQDCDIMKCLLAAVSPFSVKVVSAYLSPLLTRAIIGLPDAPGIENIQAANPLAARLQQQSILTQGPHSPGSPMSQGSEGVALATNLADKKFTMRVVAGYALQLCLFAMALNSLVSDIQHVRFKFKAAPNIQLGIAGACVTIMGSANIASYFSMILLYCLFDDTNIAGEDGKVFIFGEPPKWCPCQQRLAMLWQLFGVPKMLRWEILQTMDVIPRVHLLMLHVLYLPFLRLILIVVGFPTIVAYFWFTVPLAIFLMLTMMLLDKLMWWQMQKAVESRGFSKKQQNALKNVLRWNLVLPVVFMPNLAFGTALGVRLYMGDGYLSSFLDALKTPSLLGYLHLQKRETEFFHTVDKVFQALR